MDLTPVMRFAVDQGFLAVLFVFLLGYVLRESKNREEKLMTFLDNITEQFKKLSRQFDRIAHDVEEIKSDLRRR